MWKLEYKKQDTRYIISNHESMAVAALKNRIKETDNNIFSQQDKGFATKHQFILRQPATDNELDTFCEKTGWIIPIDFKEFLRLNNGAVLFDDLTGSAWHLYSLHEIVSYHFDYMPQDWMPIANLFGDTLFIIVERVREGRKDYLFWFESGGSFDEAYDLKSNFEIWFERLVIAQGVKFWTWSYYTVDNYYQTH